MRVKEISQEQPLRRPQPLWHIPFTVHLRICNNGAPARHGARNTQVLPLPVAITCLVKCRSIAVFKGAVWCHWIQSALHLSTINGAFGRG
jgi:hypothetical protein